MDAKLLLVKAITLLYRESQLGDANDGSSALVRQVIATVKIPEATMERDRTREIITALRQTALSMAENQPGQQYQRAEILQRIRVNCADDDSLYNAFVEGMDDIQEKAEIQLICISYRESLRTYLKRISVKDILKKHSSKALFEEDSIDWKTFVQEIVSELEPFTGLIEQATHPALVDSVSFGDLAKLKEVIAKAQEETSPEGILQGGWQAFNRMLGEYMGVRRGDFTVVGALQHNFKTGFTLSMFKHWALYNKPFMIDPAKKPMLMHISFENSLTDNIMWLYVSLKENETGEPCDTLGVSPEEAAAYVAERLQASGYTIHMCRYDPSDFTYRDLFDLVNSFEAQGYEIHGIVADYLNMMSKRGCVQAGNGADIRDLFRRVRNFMSPRKIAFVTPHQLSPEAKYLLRQGVDNFVQEVANKGYWDSCKSIDQEVDLEIIIHIEKVNGESYLTIQRGKHRKVKITPEKDLYCVLKFNPIGGIVDDVNGKDLSRRTVGGGAMADGGEDPWWK